MGGLITKKSNSLKAVEWMWQSNPNPWSNSEEPTWSHYSDLENLIIEEAFSKRKRRAIFDNYYINFANNMQISSEDEQKRRPVKRVVRKREDKHLREARFNDLPVASDRFFGGQYGFISPFVKEVRKYLGLQTGQLPSKTPHLIPGLVEEAARGFITEGKQIGRQCEAEKLAALLLKKKNSGPQEVWKRCAYLYSLESFLYKSLNATMRLVGSQGDEQTWRSKVSTLGPFCLLLWDDPFNTRMKMNVVLYRGANLKPEQTDTFKEMVGEKKTYGSFQGFSSCSRNRAKAEGFGNALFIMEVKFAFIADLSGVSEYPGEEEELVTPGVCFRVLRVEFDRDKEQHLIYLELRQRWSAADQSHLKTKFDSDREIVLDDNLDDVDDPYIADHDRDGNYIPEN